MPKERSVNPAQAQRKADKQKALKKSKANLQVQRNEKLARRNPERLQRQLDDLKALEASGELRPRDKQNLEQLEKDIRAIRKARDTLGDKAPTFSRPPRDDHERGDRGRTDGRGGSHLGKRRRDEHDARDSSETDEDVRNIPMPRDTPPPIPRSRRERPGWTQREAAVDADGHRLPHALPPKPVVAPAQTVYSAAPAIRDLRKEALRFVPASVQRNMKARKGEGELLEPEELDKLEKAGYGDAEKAEEAAVEEAMYRMMSVEDGGGGGGSGGGAGGGSGGQENREDLEAEEERFERELRAVEIEEVSDEDL
ncbi:hypothetical protein B0A49_06603 [Cryomyces minteri]|uniref:Wbp11/ELF5/Saf1 N-terminal domain-containing protein n=1 Tax=Cryomyces minteri TaxID=331657 RepID=A0A4U0WZM2_9PEZI|nr:hypothetical protein B0A49_06603 [Cryomyces minteri]